MSSGTKRELREGWILAGTLDAVPASPPLTDSVGGIPYALRLACDLAMAGVTRVFVVWSGEGAPPDLSAIAADRRLAERATLEVVTALPEGADADGVLVVRADRVYHRSVPQLAADAWRGARAALGKVEGAAYDAVIAADRATARQLAAAAPAAGGLERALAGHGDDSIATAPPPYLGFCAAAPDRRALRAAERQLVWSLRKSADGIAARLVNRHLSLRLTWWLCRTSIHPNQVTIVALLCALAGGATIATGGWAAGLIGMLLVEAGSIIDGVDGELARLRFQFSRTGQWLDTVADDLGNVAYGTGLTLSLHGAGVSWALPVGVTAIAAFLLTQATQYFLILRVYRSGDLAAIPWAFQSSEFLSQRPTGAIAWVKATVPKMLKRDFVVTVFTILAALDQLAAVLVAFATGALSFFVVLFTQLARNWGSVVRAYRGTQAPREQRQGAAT
ncbi:MAG: CDP-alcohol phosphatidyltransferase family protein [Kofleriaceae bacterium]